MKKYILLIAVLLTATFTQAGNLKVTINRDLIAASPLILQEVLKRVPDPLPIPQNDAHNISTPNWQAIIDAGLPIVGTKLFTKEIDWVTITTRGVPTSWPNSMKPVLDAEGNPTYEKDGATPITKRKRWNEYTRAYQSSDGLTGILRIHDNVTWHDGIDGDLKKCTFNGGATFEAFENFIRTFGWQNWRHGQLWISNQQVE